ncbi:MAG: hypothetical protein VYD55_04195 [Chloroflexota bacterium]|nr:hypothetical protein [Chloroflexota bacterium]
MTGEIANATVPVAAGKGLRIYKFNSLDMALMTASIYRMVEDDREQDSNPFTMAF